MIILEAVDDLTKEILYGCIVFRPGQPGENSDILR
jgi:hypothetical protein